MTEKKTRLLCEDDVIKAVDKHTNDDGNLDDDISCILEEVKDYNFANMDSDVFNREYNCKYETV